MFKLLLTTLLVFFNLNCFASEKSIQTYISDMVFENAAKNLGCSKDELKNITTSDDVSYEDSLNCLTNNILVPMLQSYNKYDKTGVSYLTPANYNYFLMFYISNYFVNKDSVYDSDIDDIFNDFNEDDDFYDDINNYFFKNDKPSENNYVEHRNKFFEVYGIDENMDNEQLYKNSTQDVFKWMKIIDLFGVLKTFYNELGNNQGFKNEIHEHVDKIEVDPDNIENTQIAIQHISRDSEWMAHFLSECHKHSPKNIIIHNFFYYLDKKLTNNEDLNANSLREYMLDSIVKIHRSMWKSKTKETLEIEKVRQTYLGHIQTISSINNEFYNDVMVKLKGKDFVQGFTKITESAFNDILENYIKPISNILSLQLKTLVEENLKKLLLETKGLNVQE